MSFWGDLKDFGGKLVKGGLPEALDFPERYQQPGSSLPVYWQVDPRSLQNVAATPPSDGIAPDNTGDSWLSNSGGLLGLGLLALGGVLVYRLVK